MVIHYGIAYVSRGTASSCKLVTVRPDCKAWISKVDPALIAFIRAQVDLI